MTYSSFEIWLIILGLGLGSFALRFSFLGMIGGRSLPPMVLRMLRYTPVAMLPGLVAPLVLWPAATGGETDGPRLLAAAATLVIGLWLRNLPLSVLGGVATLWLTGWALG